MDMCAEYHLEPPKVIFILFNFEIVFPELIRNC